ncbi:MAG: TnpV protein [Oscillospiraceae bacterium]|nr:TnpV protein [Oscillospiraceae bacterium]
MGKSTYEELGGTYTQVGDYFLPDLTIEEAEQNLLGKYGRMRKRYLNEHRPVLYTNLLMVGGLFEHLSEIDRACEDRLECIIRQMKKQENVTEALKAADQMEWVRRMNSIRSRAEEIVMRELIYPEETEDTKVSCNCIVP